MAKTINELIAFQKNVVDSNHIFMIATGCDDGGYAKECYENSVEVLGYLEKQVQKEMLLYYDTVLFDGDTFEYKTYICPHCDCKVDDEYNTNYCRECGVALVCPK
jgi:hypothetical protein